ncbi:hypothetical protein RI138_17585 [Streptomyces sp. C11-1]|uniref:Uncharacterized protein n=1 Tax=Streptomyces durocortorensis TaxID=2811104 RepID=A0ABY9W569_9ACTN|nr:hypothetical protein [Streptomyces durocortorensis]WNF31310.1 hypothetical protein RI138_17585 [Streptomyces durocortorensis]
MDMQGAADRSDAILDEVLWEIRPELRWTHGPTTVGICDLTRRRVVMTDVSVTRRGNLLGVVDRFWRKSGYRMTAVNNDAVFPAIYARTQDGFSVSLRIGGKGQAFFQVDTPCVRESEVADSTSQATAPLYEGMEFIPRPNIHSDFWSAETPEVDATSGR